MRSRDGRRQTTRDRQERQVQSSAGTVAVAHRIRWPTPRPCTGTGCIDSRMNHPARPSQLYSPQRRVRREIEVCEWRAVPVDDGAQTTSVSISR